MHYSRKGIYQTNYFRYDRWVLTAYRLGVHGDLKLRQPVQQSYLLLRNNKHKMMPPVRFKILLTHIPAYTFIKRHQE
jgi:hypothetical protein